MESIASWQQSSHHENPEQIPVYLTRDQPNSSSDLSDSPWGLAENVNEDIFDLQLQGDNDLSWEEAPGNSVDLWNDAQALLGSGNDLAGELDATGDLFPAGKKETSTTLSNFFLLNGVYHPPDPCAHCRRYNLQCLIIQTTSANPNPLYSCSTCVALFRECSLAQGQKRQASQFETLAPVIGHLHGLCEEQNATDMNPQLSPTSNYDGLAHQYQHMDATYERNKHSSSRKTQRTQLLRAWFSSHQEHPYPSPEDTVFLSGQSGMTEIQVTNWFNNARRHQRMPRSRRNFNSSSSKPNAISDMTPFQRWRHSPPEDEYLDQETISAASASTSHSFDPDCSSLFSEFSNSDSNAQADSNAVAEFSTSAPSCMSHLSTDKLYPPASPRRRTKKTPSEMSYQCTFCRVPFKKKHDWVRHEGSVHMPCLDTYTCMMPPGSGNCHPFQIWRFKSAIPECALCGHPSPDEAHYKSHDFETCSERPTGQRTFSRKDHFWQHLCKYHNCRKWEGWGLNLDLWRQRNDKIRTRCGFCGIWIDTWTRRMKHVEHHYKMGMQMDDWVGNVGIDKAAGDVIK